MKLIIERIRRFFNFENLTIFFLLLVVVSKAIFPLGIRVANDFPVASDETLKLGFGSPQIWINKTADGMGEYSVVTLWSWPLDFLGGLAERIGFNFWSIELLILLGPIFILGIISIRKIFDAYNIKNPGKLVGTLVYVANTYFLLLIDGGQLSVALTYAVFPLIFLLFKEAINGSFKKKVVAALALSVLGFLDIRYVFMFGVLILIYFFYLIGFYKERSKNILEFIKTGFTCGIVFLLLHFYWILPFLTVKLNFIPQAYDTSVKSFTNAFHSVALLHPNWYKNIFGKISDLRAEFIFMPVLAFLAPILKRRDKTVAFWVGVGIIGIFLAKGTSAPFGEIYLWLYSYLPGFNLFRDATKFFLFIALAYSILIGISVNQITKIIKPFYILIVVYLFIIISPVYLGKMTGFFSVTPYETNYAKMADILESDGQFGRIMWLPSRSPLGFISPVHPSIETVRIIDTRPFSVGRIGTYDTLNFLRSSFVGEILDIAGVKYVVYPYPDIRRQDLKEDNIKYYFDLLGKISGSSWVRAVTNFGTDLNPIPLIETKEHVDRVFAVTDTWIVVGSDQIYADLVRDAIHLANNAVIFAEEKMGLGDLINTVPFAKIILYNKSDTDLMLLLADKRQFIFPAASLKFDPDKSGWWKRDLSDVASFRSFLNEKYGIDNQDFDFGGGLAIAEGNKELAVNDKRIVSGGHLYARVLKSSKGGKIIFSQNNQTIGSIDTKTIDSGSKTNIVWVEVGDLLSDGSLKIETTGDLNVVNALVSMDKNQATLIQDKVEKLKKEGRVLTYQKNKLPQINTNTKVTYKVLSSTHYKITIKGLQNPTTLAFSENYSSLWRLGDNYSYPLYSLINGFNVSKDGEYDLVFTPQEYVNFGFKISLVAFFVILFIMLLV